MYDHSGDRDREVVSNQDREE